MDELINIQDKRAELIQLWNDLFAVCKGIVKSVKAGETTLRGSMLRELNLFLRESAAILQRLEEMEQQDAMKRAYDNAVNKPLASSGDGEWVVPFPVPDEEPLKTH